jgi:type II secretory pathway pseudopilin PulG
MWRVFVISRDPNGAKPGIGERGMSILELLIVTILALTVTAAAMEAYLRMNSQSISQEQITEMEQSGRAAARVLSQRLRMAGFGLPLKLAPVLGTDTNPDSITITHQDAGMCQAFLSAAMTQVSSNLQCSGAVLSCFQPSMWAYVYDAVADTGEYFRITSVLSGPLALAHATAPLSRLYPVGAQVSHVEQYTYYIDRSDTTHPVLMERPMGGQAVRYAEDIEDLNFFYVMQSGDTVAVPAVPRKVRNILVRLVARTPRVDRDIERDYRRREFNFNVSVRNLEF